MDAERPRLSPEELLALTSSWVERVDRVEQDSGMGAFGTMPIKMVIHAVAYVLEHGLTPENAVDHMEGQIRNFESQNTPLPNDEKSPRAKRAKRKGT